MELYHEGMLLTCRSSYPEQFLTHVGASEYCASQRRRLSHKCETGAQIAEQNARRFKTRYTFVFLLNVQFSVHSPNQFKLGIIEVRVCLGLAKSMSASADASATASSAASATNATAQWKICRANGVGVLFYVPPSLSDAAEQQWLDDTL